MLCVHLLGSAVMFWLISARVQANRLGMDVFALGNAMLGIAYVLQLLGGSPAWDMPSVFNHTLTVCVPLVYWIGAARFFGRTVPLLKPLAASALAYTLAQVLVQALWGSVPRYAMVSLVSARAGTAYISAVSRKFTPRSTARSRMAWALASSTCSPKVMVPRQMGETCRSLRPRGMVFMPASVRIWRLARRRYVGGNPHTPRSTESAATVAGSCSDERG